MYESGCQLKDSKDSSSEQATSGQVVDLASFRKSKETKTEFGRGREPLYVSHLNGKVTGKPDQKRPGESADFGDRLTRIRSSLEKINRLMADLKKMSADGPTPIATAPTSVDAKKK